MIYTIGNWYSGFSPVAFLSSVFLEANPKPAETSGKNFPADFTGLWITSPQRFMKCEDMLDKVNFRSDISRLARTRA